MDLLRLAWTFLWLSFLCIGGGLGIIPELERQTVRIILPEVWAQE